jgi:hypothetical protein
MFTTFFGREWKKDQKLQVTCRVSDRPQKDTLFNHLEASVSRDKLDKIIHHKFLKFHDTTGLVQKKTKDMYSVQI